MRPSRTSAVLTALALSLTVVPASAGSAAAPVLATTDVPVGPRLVATPLRDVLLIGGTVGALPDGRRVIWSASSGTPAFLNAVDPTSGKTLQSTALPGASGAYAVEQASDGSVFVGTYGSAHLFRLPPGASAAEDLGNPIAGEGYVWSIVVAPDGSVYGGTSPGGKVFQWSPQTHTFRDYGTVATGQTYVKSIAYANGKVYAGALASWVVTELDPITGSTQPLPLPPGMTDPVGKVVYDLGSYGGYLYAREQTFPGPLRVFDLVTRSWTDTIEGAAGLDVSPPGPDGKVWFFRQFELGSSELIGYDPGTHAQVRTGLKNWGRITNTRGIGWAPVAADGYPGDSIVGLFWRGLMFRYNPQTGQSATLQTDIAGQPTNIIALSAGPPGTVYAGGFLQGGLATVSTADGATDFRRFSQIESLLPTSHGLYLGAYPDARVYRFDQAQPWYSPEYSDGPPQSVANPAKLLDLHGHVQSRVRGLTEAAGKIVVGSTPSGDTLGGSLSIIDASTGAVDSIVDNLITDEAIVSLTTGRDGIVLGSTSIAGGLPTTPSTQDRATVFAYDVRQGRLLWQANPSPAAGTIPAVTTDGHGGLWALVDGDVLQLDPETGRTLRTLDTTNGHSSSGQLALDENGKVLYALVDGSHVVSVDVGSGRWRPLFEQPAERMAYNSGELFFAHGADLIAWKL
jgi:streptogramin lyase